jgi:hypothetical protein
LLLHLSLNQTYRLQSIEIGLPNDDSCPQTIKLFINKRNLDFSEAQSTPVTQTITINPGLETFNINLLPVKWQNCDSITIFVEDNHGSDFTTIHSVKLTGTPLMGTDVNQVKNGW